MDYKDIIRNIKNKNFENIYLLYGREYYLIDNAIKSFKESLNESMIDFNLDIIDGKEVFWSIAKLYRNSSFYGW